MTSASCAPTRSPATTRSLLRDARTYRLAPGRPGALHISCQRREVFDRIGAVHGISSVARPVFEPDHVSPIFLDEEAALAKALSPPSRRAAINGKSATGAIRCAPGRPAVDSGWSIVKRDLPSIADRCFTCSKQGDERVVGRRCATTSGTAPPPRCHRRGRGGAAPAPRPRPRRRSESSRRAARRRRPRPRRGGPRSALGR